MSWTIIQRYINGLNKNLMTRNTVFFFAMGVMGFLPSVALYIILSKRIMITDGEFHGR